MNAETPWQLPLALAHSPQYGRDSFLEGPSNSAALALIERWPDWPAKVVVLSGPQGSGKTHLAHIWAELAAAEWLRAADLDPDATITPMPGGGLVLEDVDGDSLPEPALFHLINSVTEHGGSLLLTSRADAASWLVTLPDLRSRLRMAAPARLGEPDEGLLRMVLVKLFADRQLIVETSVVDYMLLRMERSLSAAIALVDALDREALATGRSITRPLAGRVLAGVSDPEGSVSV